jgi:hypothetical protein
MSSITVQLQLGCELRIPAWSSTGSQRPAAWLARPATLGRPAMLFMQRWMQWTRLQKWHRHRSFVLCHEDTQRALGLIVRPFGA